MQLVALLYQRPGNLRMMEWAELDLDAPLWVIPRMKMKRTSRKKSKAMPTPCPCRCRPWCC